MSLYYSTAWLLLLHLSITLGEPFNYSESWEAALHKSLFENRRLVRPKAAYTDTIEIQVDLVPLFLKKLDAANQIFSLIATLVFYWEDASLAFDPASYSNATTIHVPSSLVWKPKFGVLNSAIQNVFDADTKNKYEVMVSNTGRVTWYMSETFTTSCAIDALKFPFDTQTCQVSITGWGGGAGWENYTGLPVKQTENFLMSNEWNFLRMNVTNKYYTRFGYPACSVDYSFTFKRKADFYVLSMIVPLMVLSFLGILVFPLPAESGDKIAFGITVVLSFTVMEGSVRENLPPSFPSTPYIVHLLFTMLMFNALSLTVTMTVIVVCLKKPYRKVPKWLDRYITPKGNQSETVTTLSVRSMTAVIEDENKHCKETTWKPSESGKDCVKCAHKDSQEELKEKWERVADLVNKICFVVFFVLEVAIFTVIFMGWFFL